MTPASDPFRLRWLLLLAAVLVASSAGTARAQGEPEPRATMHAVFEALSTLLPASLDEEAFADPAQRDRLQLAFEALAESTRALASHGEQRDVVFRTLSRSLADDADDIAGLYARGRLEEARFGLHQLTSRCVTCHSKLPRAREFPLAERLMSQEDVDALAPDERAHLYVATRRFDAALEIWESLLADPKLAPAWLERSGTLYDYLTVAIRVTGSHARAEATLRQAAARPDAPRYLRARLERWATDLSRVALMRTPEAPVRQAATLLDEAAESEMFPSARDGLVLELAASAMLEQYIEARTRSASPSGDDVELAEAFFLLGVLEDRTAWSYWIPQTEPYLEAALRAAPKGPRAERAYERLEEVLLGDFGAANPEELPEAERLRLRSLRREMVHEPAAGAPTT